MSEQSQGSHRRRRRRATSDSSIAAPRETPLPGPDAAPGAAPPESPHPESKPRPRPERDSGERGLRDLAGAGRSQLGVEGALRGRDVNRPTDDELAEAEETLVIVRRHWKPADKK